MIRLIFFIEDIMTWKICYLFNPKDNSTFLQGIINYKKSNLKDHVLSDCHILALSAIRQRHRVLKNIRSYSTIPEDKVDKKILLLIKNVLFLVKKIFLPKLPLIFMNTLNIMREGKYITTL